MSTTLANHELHQIFVSGDADECLKHIEGALGRSARRRQRDVYPLRLKGRILRQQGHIEESLACFEEAWAISESDTESLRERAQTLPLLGRHKEALKAYKDIGRKGCIESRDLCNMGRCYSALDKVSKALDCFRRSAAMQPTTAAFLGMSKEHEKQGDIEAAIGISIEGVRLCGSSSEQLSTLGLLHLRGGNEKAAFRSLSDAQETVGIDNRAAATLACLKQEKGAVDDALDANCDLLQSAELSELWNNLALCLMLKERHDEAVGCLEKAAELDPFDWRIHFNMGCCRLRAGYASLAVVHLKSAAALDKRRSRTWTWLGVALSTLGDTGNAKQAFHNALKLEDNAETHLHLAVALWNARDVEGAKKHLSKCTAMRDVRHSQWPEMTRLEQLLEGHAREHI